MQIRDSKVTYICDRCGASYERNKRFGFHGKYHDGIVTGILLMGCSTYPVTRADLCDDCLTGLMAYIWEDAPKSVFEAKDDGTDA